MITQRQSRDLRLLEQLRKSPSFGAIRAGIEIDRDEFARQVGWEGDEQQHADDLTLLLDLLGEP